MCRGNRAGDAGNPPQTLDSCNLTPELYKTALDVLSKSRVTHQVHPRQWPLAQVAISSAPHMRCPCVCWLAGPAAAMQPTACPAAACAHACQRQSSRAIGGALPLRLRSCVQEMTVCLGSKDHPPLTLVDLPGLIPNTADTASMDVERMVKDMLQASLHPTPAAPCCLCCHCGIASSPQAVFDLVAAAAHLHLLPCTQFKAQARQLMRASHTLLAPPACAANGAPLTQLLGTQNPATMPIIVLRAESDELATVRTELTGGRKFYAVATHLDLYDPEARRLPHAAAHT